jgi:hypothetical protein
MGWKGLCKVGLVIGTLLVAVSPLAWGTCKTGWNNPSDNDCHGGWYAGCGWHNAGGGETPYDGDWAWTDLNGDEHEYDAYGFSVPATAVIVGFEVDIRGYSEGGNGGIQVALSWNGGSTIDMAGGSTSPWSVVLPVGESSAAWRDVYIENPPFAHTFLPSEVNTNDFTVWVKANVGGTAVYVDAVRVRVEYYDEAIVPNTPLNPALSTRPTASIPGTGRTTPARALSISNGPMRRIARPARAASTAISSTGMPAPRPPSAGPPVRGGGLAM